MTVLSLPSCRDCKYWSGDYVRTIEIKDDHGHVIRTHLSTISYCIRYPIYSVIFDPNRQCGELKQ